MSMRGEMELAMPLVRWLHAGGLRSPGRSVKHYEQQVSAKYPEQIREARIQDKVMAAVKEQGSGDEDFEGDVFQAVLDVVCVLYSAFYCFSLLLVSERETHRQRHRYTDTVRRTQR